MKKIFLVLIIIIFTVSCSTLPEIGNSPDEIQKNQITHLYLKGRYIQGIARADLFKKNYPNSEFRREVEYTRGEILEHQEKFEEAYSHWVDFSKLYPDFRPSEIQEKLEQLKNKKNAPLHLRFLEFSYALELNRSGNLNRFKSDKAKGVNLAYYSHLPGRFVHGFYWQYSVFHLNHAVFPGPELTSNNYDVDINSFSIGYSFKAELKEDKLQTIISIGPALLTNVYLYSNNAQTRKQNDLGLNLNASLDYKFYDNKDSISGNGKWYLVFGVNSFYLHKLEFNNSGNNGLLNTWFVGIKL